MDLQSTFRNYLRQQNLLYGNELYFSRYLKNSDTDNQKSTNILEEYRIAVCHCKKCPLGDSRTNFVFGSGDSNANLLVIGEAPNKQEDLLGSPFVGRAGKLLDDIFRAIDKKRDRGVYITNILKCKPPNSRDPLPSEVDKCEPYLLEQIKKIKPKLILALGRVTGKILLKTDVPLKEMREKTHNYNGTPLRVTYHPASLLRNPDFKKLAWVDFQWIRDYLKD